MKRLLLLLIISLAFLATATYAFSGSGAGTSGNPYQITTCIQLQEMNDAKAAYYVLASDIDCSDTINWNSGKGFIPIGMPVSCGGKDDCGTRTGAQFTGSLDGAGHTITHLYINRPTEYFVAFMGATTNAAVVDIGLTDINVTGYSYVAGLIGYANLGSTSRTYVTGNIQAGYDESGGLIAVLDESDVNDSFTSITIASAKDSVGGLIGKILYEASTVTNSFSQGTVSGIYNVGGLVGYLWYGTVENSFSTSTASGTGYVGGLVGRKETTGGTSTITNSYFTGTNNSLGTYQSSGASYFTGTVYTDQKEPFYTDWNFTGVWNEVSETTPRLYFVESTTGTAYATTGTFTSQIINLGTAKSFESLVFDVNTPTNTSVTFKIRTATTSGGLSSAPWLGPDGTTNTSYSASGTAIPALHDGNSFAQWKATLSTTDSGSTPQIIDVNIVTKNKIDGNAVFNASTGTLRTFTTITPTVTTPGGTGISWYYCTTTFPCTWTPFTNGENINTQSSYLYLRALTTPSTTNVTPTITSIRVDYTTD